MVRFGSYRASSSSSLIVFTFHYGEIWMKEGTTMTRGGVHLHSIMVRFGSEIYATGSYFLPIYIPLW